MLTVRAAAQLLEAADSLDALAPVAAVLGFAPNAAALDAATARALGMDDAVIEARVAQGPGAVRALMILIRPNASLATTLPRLAARLAARAPHVLWTVLATQAPSRVAMAAWADDRRPPRVAALVADRGRIVDSDAETLRALAAAARGHDLVVHARWIEILGREALTARFYRALERAVATIAASSHVGAEEVRRELALLDASRLLFLSFLEAKGWLDGDRAFVLRQFEECVTNGGGFRRRVLRPLFFGTLNTPIARRAPAARSFGRVPFLNGGLFARTALERSARAVTFSDDAYGVLLFDVFAQFRFTAHEESADWSEAAVDPEMLGRAFESLMAVGERRRTGAFFTPFALVDRVASAGLDAALGEHASLQSLERITVLDPACGSGAFLVHTLERLAALRVRLGDARDVATVRRDVLTRSIFGVDLNPTAVWLCELRLWLSIVIESAVSDPAAVVPLPNLDRNIRVGDALLGGAFGRDHARVRDASGAARLRERYVRATGSRKETLARALDRAERIQAIAALDAELASIRERRRDLLLAQRGRDLFGGRTMASPVERRTAADWKRRAAECRALKRRLALGGALPFSFAAHFADVAACGGFDLVVGNPPWVRLHRVDAAQRVRFRRDFEVARTAAWDVGAARAGAASGFAAQVDVAALFVERSVELLAPRGSLALLLPAKLWCSLAGGGVRRLIARDTRVCRIEDYSDGLAAFDAAVYPSLIAATRIDASTTHDAAPVADVEVAVARGGNTTLAWRAERALAFDESPGAPWLLLPADPRRAFDRLMRAGHPLSDSPVGRPHLGVKCGLNDAFIVRVNRDSDADVGDVVRAAAVDGSELSIERALLRPLLRGEQLRRWCVPPGDDAIVWTHAATGAALPRLPAHAARWFAHWRTQLISRADARHASRWWTLFRTEAARDDRPRVVWADLGREPRASVLVAGDTRVPLNSCYIARCRDLRDADFLAALLNSPLARAWLNAVAEPARGGYRRYFGWTLSLLPVPRDWPRARDLLAPIGALARAGDVPSERALLEATCDAYGIALRDVEPLVSWVCA